MLEKIARIQDKIGVLVKDTKAYNYKYVDLNQIIEKLNPLLREEGLVLTQPILDGSVFTRIYDKEEKFAPVESFIKLPENVKPQDLGSAITYYRRYTLVSLLALTSEEDDDGKKAHESSVGLPKEKFEKLRTDYDENKIAPPIGEWEKMSYEQKKVINDIKLKNRK
jgi:hypothetical protein